MNMLIRLILLFILFLTSQSGIAAMNTFTEHQYDVNHIALGEEIYSYDASSNPRHCCQTPSVVNTQDRSFFAFVSDFLVTKRGGDFFKGTKYTDKVKKQMQQGDFHSFPESVKGFQGAGKVSKLKGGDGVVRDKLEIPGWYRGREGKFEFIKEPNGSRMGSGLHYCINIESSLKWPPWPENQDFTYPADSIM